MKRTFDDMFTKCTPEELEYMQKLIACALGRPPTPPAEELCLTPKRQWAAYSPYLPLKTEYPTLEVPISEMAGFSDTLKLSIKRNLKEDDGIDIYMIVNCIKTLQIYGFKVETCISTTAKSDNNFYLNFGGFCGMHHRKHSQNNFYVCLKGRNPSKCIISCHHTRTEDTGKRQWRSVDYTGWVCFNDPFPEVKPVPALEKLLTPSLDEK